MKFFYAILPYFYSILLLTTISCKSSKVSEDIATSKPSLVTFLDSTEASIAIVYDDPDGFYNTLSPIEVSIQMKNSAIATKSKVDALKEYKRFIQSEVSTFNLDEKSILFETVTKVKKLVDLVNPRLWPAPLQIAKIKTNHLGADVFYTRGNVIFIPDNIFTQYSDERYVPIILHEIFHILSRRNTDFRTKSYSLVGFEKLAHDVVLPGSLSNIILSNPDGAHYNYGMQLNDSTLVLPFITSKYGPYSDKHLSFFDYLDFNLYAIKKVDNYYMVEASASGQSTLNLRTTPTFFTKIKDNTQYIIHPDEIMADNFMLAILAYNNDEYDKFSKGGLDLIKDLQSILQAF